MCDRWHWRDCIVIGCCLFEGLCIIAAAIAALTAAGIGIYLAAELMMGNS